MKRLSIISLLVLLMSMISVQIFSQTDYTSNGIYFILENGEAYVTYNERDVDEDGDPDYNDYSGEITIPSSVTYYSKTYPVTSIGQLAFYKCSGLTNVTIPSSVTNIEFGAFSGCSSLTSLTIPSSVTNMGERVFVSCSSLTNVTIESTTPPNIYSDTFEGLSSTTTLYVPSGSKVAYEAKSNWKNAFKDIVEIPNITFDDANVKALCVANWDSNGDGELSEAEAAAVNSLGNVFKGNYEITSFDELQFFTSLTSIGEEAFENCKALASVTIPSWITNIGEDAFYNCNGLQRVNITDLEAWCNISFGSQGANPLTKAHYLYLNGERIDDLVIPNSVEQFKSHIFSCGWFSSVTIPSTANFNYGSGQFRGAKIGETTLNQSVNSYAFYYATINHLVISSTMTYAGNLAFYGATIGDLEIPYSENDLTWESGKDSYGMFEDATIETAIVDRHIKQSYGSNKRSAFYGTNISKLTIGSHAVYSTDALCAGCRITDLYFDGITEISSYAFYSNSNSNTISNIHLPYGLSSIGSEAFRLCSVSSVIIQNETPVGIDENTFGSRTNATLYVPTGSKAAYEAADYWKDFKEIIEFSVPSPAIDFADANIKELCIANWDTDGDGELSEAEAAAVESLDEVFREKTTITSFDELKYFTGLTEIGDNAFRSCSHLTSVTIPNTIISIGETAFYYCSGLTSITIPSSVTYIDEKAFGGCSSLTSVQISDLISWCNISFDDKDSNPLSYAHHLYISEEEVKALVFPDNITALKNYTFAGGSDLTSVIIPNSVTSIGFMTFWGCSSLTSVTIPSSVTSIGDNAFNSCTKLESVTIGNGLTSIPIGLFQNCTALTSINIPSSVTSIGGLAFNGCVNLTSLSIPDNIEYVGTLAFEGSGWYENLSNGLVYIGKVAYKYKGTMPSNTEIIIQDGTTLVASSAFSSCSGLSSIILPSSLKTIGNGAFSYCDGLSSITLPDGITTIENNAFYQSNIQSVIIPSSVTAIGDYAFWHCPLKTVEIHVQNPLPITNQTFGISQNSATLYVPYGCLSAYSSNLWWSYFQIVEMPAPSPAIDFADANVKELCIANWDTNGDGELSEAEAAAVSSLGEVFKGSSEITSFNELQYFTGITELPAWNAFNDCSSLNSIVIPAGVTSIEGSSFANCTALRNISVDAGNSVYDSRNNCNAIIETATNKLVVGCETTQIPNGITTIGSTAFWGKWGMQKMAIPETITTIEGYAFAYCVSLSSISLPASVNTIGVEVFSNCGNLTSFHCYMETPPAITEDVFSNRANATLYVPAGSKTAYEAADYWKEFGEIVGMTNIIANSDLEGDDVSCFYIRENMDVVDEIIPATIVGGVGKDGSRGIVVQSVDNPQEAWNTQLFVRMPQSLPAGTKYRLMFDYKASQDAQVTMESHKEPSEFISGFGSTTFNTSWQHYESEGTITEVQSPNDNQMRTIGFTLAYTNTATTYYFDNIVFEIENTTNIIEIGPDVNLENVVAGTLSTLIPNDKYDVVVNLSISGNLNADDFAVISQLSNLETLTITANIIGGIPAQAFQNHQHLNSVSFTGTDDSKYGTRIGDYAFDGCTALTSYDGLIASLGDFCFRNTNVAGLTLSAVQYWEGDGENKNGPFQNEDNREFYYVGNNPIFGANKAYFTQSDESELTGSFTIDGNALYSNDMSILYALPKCSSYSNSEITEIADYAVSGNSNLSVFEINNITTIGEGFLYKCPSLEEIICPSNNSAFTVVNEVLYTKDMTELVKYPWVMAEESMTIPSTVNKIRKWAFERAEGLTTITIEATTPPTLNELSFDDFDFSSATLYVPVGCKAAYEAAPYWQNFNKIKEQKQYSPDYIPGDANGDGVIDTQDAIKVVQYYLGKNPTDFNILAADVNNDGVVDTQDAIQIIKIYLKK